MAQQQVRRRRRRRRRRRINYTRLAILLTGLFTFVMVILIGFTMLIAKPGIKLVGEPSMTLEAGDEWVDPGVKATVKYPLLNPSAKKAKVSGSVKNNKLGEYKITYTVGNFIRNKSVTRKVKVIDTTAPEITLVEQDDLHLTKPGDPYMEVGYSAYDKCDGDITDKVTFETQEDGTILYSVTDASGNTGTAVRTIRYVDQAGPTITLNGGDTMKVVVGSTYSEPGFSAIDDQDGDVTSKVQVNGAVDTNTAGTYTITYEVTDTAGNKTTKTRIVTVGYEEAQEVIEGEKTIFLTFNGGPGKYTQQLLDILAKYNVKATFFACGVNFNYFPVIRNIHDAGHNMGIGSLSNDAKLVYASSDAFYTDLQNMRSIINQNGGGDTNLIRFVGGSGNDFSKNYSEGVMTYLVTDVQKKGYKYFDWNVDSYDTSSAKTEQQVIDNVINGIQKNRVSIVLLHDSKEYSVKAVDTICKWGLQNGYTFLPLDANSWGAHQTVLN